MVERRRQAFGAAAVALVHPDHIHAPGKALGGNPLHVAGIARALEAVDNDDRQRALPVALPVTVHPDLDAGFDFDEARLGGWKSDAAREEEAGQGLPMSAAQATA